MKYWGLACYVGWLMSLGSGCAHAAIPSEDWHVAVVNDHRLFYAVTGRGPTLALLHGGGDSGEPSFERGVDFLPEQHRWVAPDQVGQGRTPDVPGPLSYTGMMEDTVALLHKVKLRRAAIVGF